ncbi:uncharacterized protein [Atheta coriaria]|uniref:uncharacterized protein isoform X2 n=1 Tax=Dalotia coriaria TaxID=877792 RepID=UPI0031F4279B
MCDTQWDPLVEFLFRVPNASQTSIVFCVCSRSFSRTKDEKDERNRPINEESASESDLKDDPAEDDFPEDHVLLENDFHCRNSDLKLDVDAEVVSCYCSASHTDNISTDEHDSIREHSTRTSTHSHSHSHSHRGLQSSDSGADLTELHARTDADAAWHRFWAHNGERLIWDSWITKYSDYINPDYLTATIQDDDGDADAKDESQKHSKCKFSFDKRDIEKLDKSEQGGSSNLTAIDENQVLKDSSRQDIIQRNRQLVRNLSNSDSFDKLTADISEGWNPLSPLSVDCETEAERLLLSSRCGSYASGSLRTVDSMTNVTRMTVSSIDLSESSKNSESFSSVSSVQSSLSSTSSEDLDDNAEHDNQWNCLWKKHYEDEYLRQYKKFMSIQTGGEDVKEAALPLIAQSLPLNQQVLQSFNKTFKANKSNNSSFEDTTEGSSRKKIRRKTVENVVALLGSIKMDDGSDAVPSTSRDIDYVAEVDEETLKSLGLPTSFSRKKAKKQLSKSFSSLESEGSAQSMSDRVKSAFNLMGIELHELGEPKLNGQVEYKMKHIRLQNRHLKLHKPVHKYFDDDGNEIVYEHEENAKDVDLKSTSSSEDLLSPANDAEIAVTAIEKVLTKNQKRRRFRDRKKRQLPPEIKENPKLRKYWERRFSLFNKFDMGIKLDEESWYSVTPETVAKHIAERCKCDVIVDAFCGAGGNAIQFAKTCVKVIAIDIDPKKIELASHNAEVYGVRDRIEFINGDFFAIAERLKANVVFLSPPWGGPAYLHRQTYELEEMLQPLPLSKLLESARKISTSVALFLPKNSNTYPLIQEAGPGGFVEIEQNFLNKKLIAMTAFYNDLIQRA